MKAKPRWMKAVLEAAGKEVPPLPFVRQVRRTAPAAPPKRG
jgi:hypothetical protein